MRACVDGAWAGRPCHGASEQRRRGCGTLSAVSSSPLYFLPLIAYFVGSIPCGYLLAKSQGIDIRTKGSGNIGATNVGRVLGKRWGFLCFFLDFLKGFAPAVLCGLLLARGLHGLYDHQPTLLYLATALGAVLGHMFPAWLKFKGGKGIATGFGALLGVFPVFTVGAVIAILTWAVLVKITRMVGISSVLAGVALAAWVVFSYLAPRGVQDALENIGFYRRATWIEAAFAAGLCALIVYKHRGNIARTIAGTEPKIGRKG